MEHEGGSITDYDMLVCEILSRLPVKSLMRFKCVCKQFRYIIQEDEYFIGLHYNRSRTRPGLFIIMPRYPRLSTSLFNGPWSLPATMDEKCFLLADIIECEDNQVAATKAVIHTIRNTDANEFDYKLILGPVNGLICFVDWEVKNSNFSISNFYIRTFNVSTREITPWMKSSFLREEKGEHCGSREVTSKCFQLGFDPVNKETKLVGVWSIRKKHCNAYFVCEVLTLSSNTWRRIDNVPLYNIQNNSVYLNGSIYWRSNKPLFKEFDNADAEDANPKFIVAFDVGSEKFRVIPVPSFMDDKFYRLRWFDLFVMVERLAFFSWESRFLAKLWILQDEPYSKNRVTSTTGATIDSDIQWTEEIISIPSNLSFDLIICQAIPGTDQIILQCHVSQLVEFVAAYSYSREKKVFKKIEIGGLSPIPEIRFPYLFTVFVESLYSVQKLRQIATTTDP
ncbi:F-box protein At1g30790-like [Papaver somniferum]|uniref:F-box protein At1g30790-like n=1 Tax=Papaver somniferum TaxID=3469 RepID=UPI000E6FB769|nr:F-box protein At1g30790-like [Papaver somniferum]